MKKISIGIDFSKQTFDATIIYRDGDCFKELGYSKFNNDGNGFKTFLRWTKTIVKVIPEAKDRSTWIFCGEHTGTCSIGLSDFLSKKKYFMWLESALVIHRKCGIIREKNDKIDSKRIAEYALRNYSDEVEAYEMDSDSMKKLKSLYAAHDILTKDKISKINQIKSGTLSGSSYALKEIENQLTAIEDSLSKIDSEIQSLLKQCDEFSHN